MADSKTTAGSSSAPSNGSRVRYSVRELQDKYDNGDKKPLEDLMRAWHKIKSLPPEDVRSFFNVGGYHGEPFVGPGALSSRYWGGYCNHGNVLFPTWHRVYLLKLEEALQSAVPGVMMPYWDETSEETLAKGIPWCLTAEKIEINGHQINNPLRSFVLPVTVRDSITKDDNEYTKPAGYETVRYPLSGLVGTPIAQYNSALHNAKFPDPEKNTKLLNDNIKAWMRHDDPSSRDPTGSGVGIYSEYVACLRAPNYTVFSNTTSAAHWNDQHTEGDPVVPLEQPHNDIHLAVGGFDVPGQGEYGQIAGANGDMGENDTAALDPIFFFHHCNVDRMFWLWQKRHGKTDDLEIIADYPGTSSTDSQGPTPYLPPDTPLGLDTPLQPFLLNDETDQRVYTSRDCINIEKQLGLTYSAGSLDGTQAVEAVEHRSKKRLVVSGIDRALFRGSFVIVAHATTANGKTYRLGVHSVLSRWNVSKCANCQTHLMVTAHFPLSSVPEDELEGAKFSVTFQYRGESLPAGLTYETKVVG